MKNKKPASLVFIAGLGHSGSTLFDLLLGAQPGVTGLGEIDVFLNQGKNDWYIERFDKYPCTCGERPSECAVWGKIKPFLEENSSKTYAEKYRKIFETALENTDSNIIVDSSKNLNALTSVYESLDKIGISKEQFHVIHLVKDVRSFAASDIRAGRSSNVIRIYKAWKRINQKFEAFLKDNNIKTLHVGYDELTLSTKYLMEKILHFISGDATVTVDLKKSNSHIISGNNMRLYQAEIIRYDYRWFNDWKVNLFYSIYPSIKKLNTKWVYSNVEHFLEKKSKFKPPKVVQKKALKEVEV